MLLVILIKIMSALTIAENLFMASNVPWVLPFDGEMQYEQIGYDNIYDAIENYSGNSSYLLDICNTNGDRNMIRFARSVYTLRYGSVRFTPFNELTGPFDNGTAISLDVSFSRTPKDIAITQIQSVFKALLINAPDSLLEQRFFDRPLLPDEILDNFMIRMSNFKKKLLKRDSESEKIANYNELISKLLNFGNYVSNQKFEAVSWSKRLNIDNIFKATDAEKLMQIATAYAIGGSIAPQTVSLAFINLTVNFGAKILDILKKATKNSPDGSFVLNNNLYNKMLLEKLNRLALARLYTAIMFPGGKKPDRNEQVNLTPEDIINIDIYMLRYQPDPNANLGKILETIESKINGYVISDSITNNKHLENFYKNPDDDKYKDNKNINDFKFCFIASEGLLSKLKIKSLKNRKQAIAKIRGIFNDKSNNFNKLIDNAYNGVKPLNAEQNNLNTQILTSLIISFGETTEDVPVNVESIYLALKLLNLQSNDGVKSYLEEALNIKFIEMFNDFAPQGNIVIQFFKDSTLDVFTEKFKTIDFEKKLFINDDSFRTYITEVILCKNDGSCSKIKPVRPIAKNVKKCSASPCSRQFAKTPNTNILNTMKNIGMISKDQNVLKGVIGEDIVNGAGDDEASLARAFALIDIDNMNVNALNRLVDTIGDEIANTELTPSNGEFMLAAKAFYDTAVETRGLEKPRVSFKSIKPASRNTLLQKALKTLKQKDSKINPNDNAQINKPDSIYKDAKSLPEAIEKIASLMSENNNADVRAFVINEMLIASTDALSKPEAEALDVSVSVLDNVFKVTEFLSIDDQINILMFDGLTIIKDETLNENILPNDKQFVKGMNSVSDTVSFLKGALNTIPSTVDQKIKLNIAKNKIAKIGSLLLKKIETDDNNGNPPSKEDIQTVQNCQDIQASIEAGFEGFEIDNQSYESLPLDAASRTQPSAIRSVASLSKKAIVKKSVITNRKLLSSSSTTRSLSSRNTK